MYQHFLKVMSYKSGYTTIFSHDFLATKITTNFNKNENRLQQKKLKQYVVKQYFLTLDASQQKSQTITIKILSKYN
jgi:hypothetical protein